MERFEEIDDEQSANPFDIRRELLNAIDKAIDKAFAVVGANDEKIAAVVTTEAVFAAKDVFDRYFIRT